VDVGVHEAGEDSGALEIDSRGAGAGGFCYGVARAYGYDAIASDSDGIGDAELRIDRHDFAVIEEEVGVLGWGNSGEEDQAEAHERSSPVGFEWRTPIGD